MEHDLPRIEDEVDMSAARRIIDHELLRLVKQMAGEMRIMRQTHAEMEAALRQHMSREEEWRDKFIGGFPHGDPTSHRMEHESDEQWRKGRARLMSSVAEKTAIGLVWALMLLVGYAVWEYVRSKIGSPH